MHSKPFLVGRKLQTLYLKSLCSWERKGLKSTVTIVRVTKQMWPWEIYWFSNRHAPRNTRERNVRSKIWWFTEFCNSHYLSQFAAFFIVARAKRSVVKSCFSFHQGELIQTKKILLGWVSDPPLNVHGSDTWRPCNQDTQVMQSCTQQWPLTGICKGSDTWRPCNQDTQVMQNFHPARRVNYRPQSSWGIRKIDKDLCWTTCVRTLNPGGLRAAVPKASRTQVTS